MPDIYKYGESLTGMNSPTPIVLLKRVHTLSRRDMVQWVTTPGELVSEHVALAPDLGCNYNGDVSFGFPVGSAHHAISWKVIHVATGIMVLDVKFLEWARECARRLVELPLDWSRPDVVDDPTFRGIVAPVVEEFRDRQDEFDRKALSGSPAERKRTYRRIRQLGGEYIGTR